MTEQLDFFLFSAFFVFSSFRAFVIRISPDTGLKSASEWGKLTQDRKISRPLRCTSWCVPFDEPM